MVNKSKIKNVEIVAIRRSIYERMSQYPAGDDLFKGLEGVEKISWYE